MITKWVLLAGNFRGGGGGAWLSSPENHPSIPASVGKNVAFASIDNIWGMWLTFVSFLILVTFNRIKKKTMGSLLSLYHMGPTAPFQIFVLFLDFHNPLFFLDFCWRIAWCLYNGLVLLITHSAYRMVDLHQIYVFPSLPPPIPRRPFSIC